MAAIQTLLTPDETALVARAIQNMPPETLAHWRKELLGLTPEEAAERVRSGISAGTTS
jgi:hypothetical protein